MGGKKSNIYEGIIYKANFKNSPFKKVVEHLIDPNLKYEEGNDLMVDLIKLYMSLLYGQSIRKDIDEEYIIRSENWLVKNNDERVVDYGALPNGENVVKNISDPGIDKIKEVEKSMPTQLDIFVLSQSKGIMNKFDDEIDGFYSNKVYYQDTDSLYTHTDQYEKFKGSWLYLKKKLKQRKNDYGDRVKFYGLFSAPKTKLCYTIEK